MERISRKNRKKNRPQITSSDLYEIDDVAQKWDKTPTEFRGLSEEDRTRMAAKAIMEGWIDMVANDV